MSHTHSHGGGGGHGHSHAPAKFPTQYKRIPSNKHLQRLQDEERFESDVLANSTEAAVLQLQQPTFINNGGGRVQRSDSVCSYRSPIHSRTNSFSKTLATTTTDETTTTAGRRSNSFSRILNELPAANGDVVVHSDNHNNHSHYRRMDSADSNLTNSTNEMDDLHFNHHQHDDDDDHVQKNINIQAAVIHVIGDFIQSVGVFIAAVVINYYVSVHCNFIIHSGKVQLDI